MKLAEYVASFIASYMSPEKGKKPRVYTVCGAGAMHLNDAICHHPGIEVLAMHHEQAAAYAAEGDARVSNYPAVVHVTAGPGGTNAITGIACAWVDSIPMLVICGQATRNTLNDGSLRQLGCNELDTLRMVVLITKWAVRVNEPREIRYILEKALHLANSGRKGPVFIEIPLDVQAAEIEYIDLAAFNKSEDSYHLITPARKECGNVVRAINEAERPIVIVGNGVRLAGASSELGAFLGKSRLPVLSSWNANDLIPTASDTYIGRPGIMGDRAGNFAVQNADVILAIGTRLSVPQTGHSPDNFAPNAKLIMVDVDPAEIRKGSLNVDLGIVADAKEFLRTINEDAYQFKPHPEWLRRCQDWKARYPVMLPEYRTPKSGINSYHFIEELAKRLDDDAVIVTDVGTAFIGAMQSMPLRGTQRLFHSSGVAPMGYGLPAAIGAYRASGKQTICLAGDGGIMFNLQELQTIAHHKLPIGIFVLCNNGYGTIQYTQGTHFKRESVSSPQSGVGMPDFCKVAAALGIYAAKITGPDNIGRLGWITKIHGPVLCEVQLPPNQPLAPRVQSQMKDGKFIPASFEDMWPYLPRDEFRENMNVEACVAVV